MPHSVVKQAENYRVRELVKKIENHPHRQSLQLDLQRNKAYNPFSETTKKMIKDVGNVELFELFETDPKTQCKACLSCWSEGIVYRTCGHLLKEIVANRGFIVYTLELVQNSVSLVDKKPQFEIDLRAERSISRRNLTRWREDEWNQQKVGQV